MKPLSLLLLLTLGLGAAWWTRVHPEGTLEDVGAEADALATRAGALLERARLGTVDALGLAVGRPENERNGAAGDTEPAPADPPAAVEPDTGAAAPPEASPVGTRLTTVETRLGEALGAGPDTLRTRLAEVERRLDAARARDAAARESVAALDRRLLALAERFDAYAAADADGDGDADALRVAGVGTVESGDVFAGTPPDPLATGLDRRLERLESRLDEADLGSERLETLAARVDALDAADGEPRRTGAADASVDAVHSAIRTELAVLGEQVDEEATSEDAPALGQALESTRERLAALEARVRSMPDSSAASDAAKSTQDALEEQVRALERRLEALPGTDPGLVSSISEVREQVDELASRGFVTEAELRERAEGRDVEYKIYFGANSTEVGEDAARVLDAFLAEEMERTSGVSIFGFTDRRGPASYNQRLALERAQNVRSYLIRNGLPYTKIRTLSGLGEDAAAAILPDDADDAEQRVVVLYAAQP